VGGHARPRRPDSRHLPDPRRGPGHAQHQGLPGNRDRLDRSVAAEL